MTELEATLNRIAIQQELNTIAIAEGKAETAVLRSAISTLVQAVSLHQQEIETSQRNFETMQNEIKGLQVENRRILEELRGRNNG